MIGVDFMDKDFNNIPPFMDFSSFQQLNGFNPSGSPDMNDLYRDPMFNPMAQYEQAFLYYRYLCMQMDYKIKCKEYEKMCNTTSGNSERTQRRVE
jgi:hypothetical protein